MIRAGLASGAVRHFAALFYQALGQLEPNDHGVWEFAMDELGSIANGQKGKRTGRDYVRKVMQEPEVPLSDD